MDVTQLNGETIEELITRSAARCATSNGKLLLVLWTKDSNECFLPLIDKGLQLHHGTVEFTDSDDGLMTLPFSRIGKVEIDNEENWQFPTAKFRNEPGADNVRRFRKPSES